MPEATLYTRQTIDQLAWPDTPDGAYARNYLLPLMHNGPQTYIRNVHNTEVMVVKVGETVLPVTSTDFHPANTYTCSPYSHYISYGGYEEVHRLHNPALEALVKGLLAPLGWYLQRSGFDCVAYVNNWLLSTNLYPPLDAAQIAALVDTLPQLFPGRAIIFRSVDETGNPALYAALRQRGFRMVLSRQVWYMQPQEAQRKRQYKEDLRELRQHPYEVVSESELSDAEIERCLALYNSLYLEKYSYYNPQFTPAFLRLARDAGLLHLRALRLAGGQIDAVMGFFARNGLMTQPLFGYDTALPAQAGLYRLLTLVTLQEGRQRGLTVHASAGVGKFKKLRGAQPAIEYNAVFDRHLPPARRLPWAIVQAITDRAIPFFRKYDL